MDARDEKLKEIFPSETVNKDLSKKGILASRALPSYVVDWLVSRYSDGTSLDEAGLQKFLDSYLPDKSKSEEIKHRLICERERVSILAEFRVVPDVRSGEERLEIPILDISGKDGRVSPRIASQNRELLNGGCWGKGDLSWTEGMKPGDGRIVLDEFAPFKPFSANLEYYRKARMRFSLDEWIDTMLRSMEYNPDAFESSKQKLLMISRLLPFIEPRINMMELAPKGTGKSYVFGRLTKYGWLISGGSVSRAQLFYDISRKKRGLITRFDYIALDEIQTIKFDKQEEIAGALKGYLESGEYRIAGYHGEAEAGFVLLGNIELSGSGRPKNEIYITLLPNFMQESAFLDRFHILLEGWMLPRISENSIVKGYSLNSDFFAEIMHELRKDTIPASIVSKSIDVPPSSDKRDTTAVKRIATAYVKLLFPHARKLDDISPEDFEMYCLNPAKQMRGIIRKQLHLIDPEFKPVMPDLQIRPN